LVRKVREQTEDSSFYSETTAKPRWKLGSWQCSVIKAILQSERSLTWMEIQEMTGLDEKSLNKALFDLYSSNEVRKIRGNTKKQFRYQISENLNEIYPEFCSPKTRLLKWIKQWKDVKDLAFPLEHEHFFLEGRHLDDFSKELICHAENEVMVANPFIQECDLSNTLREAKRNGVDVHIITRVPKDSHPEYLKKKQEYHLTLKREGIPLLYSKKVHAKIIIVDQAIAVVGSMNFYPNSSAGVSWEAGLVSADSNTVKTIVNSFLNMLTNDNGKGEQFSTEIGEEQ